MSSLDFKLSVLCDATVAVDPGNTGSVICWSLGSFVPLTSIDLFRHGLILAL